MEKVTSGKRLRTCRACGKQFEYPVKGSAATRHHCEECVQVPAHLRVVAERLSARLANLERQVKRLQPPSTIPAQSVTETTKSKPL
jgi:hypothetical protein